jgi:hypothetical protein
MVAMESVKVTIFFAVAKTFSFDHSSVSSPEDEAITTNLLWSSTLSLLHINTSL